MQQHPEQGEQRVTPRAIAALYFRVSTSDQSTGMQETDLRRYAEARGLTVFKEYRDHAVSGGKERRPALDKLLDDARKRRFDVVVVLSFGVEWWLSEHRSLHHTGAASSIFN